MSSEVIIEARDIHKRFPIYEKPHHRLFQMLRLGGAKRWFREFEALRGVDFKIARGETVGVVGRNGSGKSTLLQIICGTLAASSGELLVKGRVAALLELGAGFNPEFTGRENVFLNAAVLGLGREEVTKKFSAIQDFAAIGEFIDRPVKTYSSGMYVRLAFAVAIHVDPDILVVDEALSVGDEAFQRKCFARIEKLRQDGCTVLFVSHAASMVIELCDRAILLDGGEVLADGAPKGVISRYQKLIYAPTENAGALRQQMRFEYLSGTRAAGGEGTVATPVGTSAISGVTTAPGDEAEEAAYFDEGLVSQSEVAYANRGAVIESARIESPDGARVNVLKAGDRYFYSYGVRFEQGAAMVRFGMLIKTLTGIELAGAVSSQVETAIDWIDAGSVYRVRFEFICGLAPGVYFMNAGVQGRLGEEDVYLDRRIDVAMFRVIARPRRLTTGFIDLVERVEAEALASSAGQV